MKFVIRKALILSCLGAMIVSFQNCAGVGSIEELKGQLTDPGVSPDPSNPGLTGPSQGLFTNACVIEELQASQSTTYLESEANYPVIDTMSREECASRGDMLAKANTDNIYRVYQANLADFSNRVPAANNMTDVLTAVGMTRHEFARRAKDKFPPTVLNGDAFDRLKRQAYLCYSYYLDGKNPEKAYLALEVLNDAMLSREHCLGQGEKLWKAGSSLRAVATHHLAAKALKADWETATTLEGIYSKLNDGKLELTYMIVHGVQPHVDPIVTKPKSCAAATLTAVHIGNNLSGTADEEQKCSGAMPATAGATSNVTVDSRTTNRVTGSTCKEGNRNISDLYTSSHTFTSPSYGTCKNYCQVVADCTREGKWVNPRFNTKPRIPLF